MGKVKATLATASAPAADGETAISASNVTPIGGRQKATATGDSPEGVGAGVAAVSENEPALIVFGKDEAGKAHASWFGAADAELAERAAGLMRYRVLRVTSPDIRANALELAKGRVFASGRCFSPFAKMASYDALQAFGEAYQPPVPVEPELEPAPVATGTPQRWEDITVGSMVLATVGPDEGWYEAVITEARGDALFVLRWQGWPDHDAFVRRVDGLALLPVAATAPAPASIDG